MMPKNKILLTLLAMLSNASISIAAESPQFVPGEALVPVTLSSRSPNDIICRGGKAIDHFITKGLPVEITRIPDDSGWMLSMQYQVSNMGNRKYMGESFDAYFVCSTGKYKITINPSLESSKTVWLGDGMNKNIDENIKQFNENETEKFAADLATQIINDNGKGDFLPESYEITRPSKSMQKWFENVVDGAAIRPLRVIKVNGTGIKAIEYQVRGLRTKDILPKDYLQTPLGLNIFSITPEITHFEKGTEATLVITYMDRG